jgi:hypothetical protein
LKPERNLDALNQMGVGWKVKGTQAGPSRSARSNRNRAVLGAILK